MQYFQKLFVKDIWKVHCVFVFYSSEQILWKNIGCCNFNYKLYEVCLYHFCTSEDSNVCPDLWKTAKIHSDWMHTAYVNNYGKFCFGLIFQSQYIYILHPLNVFDLLDGLLPDLKFNCLVRSQKRMGAFRRYGNERLLFASDVIAVFNNNITVVCKLSFSMH